MMTNQVGYDAIELGMTITLRKTFLVSFRTFREIVKRTESAGVYFNGFARKEVFS